MLLVAVTTAIRWEAVRPAGAEVLAQETEALGFGRPFGRGVAGSRCAIPTGSVGTETTAPDHGPPALGRRSGEA